MDLLKKLSALFSAAAPGGQFHTVSVQCKRCGEVIQAKVNLMNDLSVEYDANENVSGYICRKLLMGKGRCFQQIEVTLTFDAKRKLTDRQVSGGTFVDG